MSIDLCQEIQNLTETLNPQNENVDVDVDEQILDLLEGFLEIINDSSSSEELSKAGAINIGTTAGHSRGNSGRDNNWDQKDQKDQKVTKPKKISVRQNHILVLEIVCSFVKLNLKVIYPLASDCQFIISDVILKLLRIELENENVFKGSSTSSSHSVKRYLIDTISTICASFKASIKGVVNHMLDLLREDHLCEFVAEIMHQNAVDYETVEFFDLVLKLVGEKRYSDKDQDKVSKNTARFLLKLTDLQPHRVLKSMVNLNDLLDSENAGIRAVMMEVIGSIIHLYLAPMDPDSPNLVNFCGILSQRLLDVKPVVRARVCKVIGALSRRIEGNPGMTEIPLHLRQGLVEAVIQRLCDKSSLVRKKAVEVTGVFLDSSPFIAVASDMGALSASRFEKRVAELSKAVEEARMVLETNAELVPIENPNQTNVENQDGTNPNVQEATLSPNQIMSLQTNLNQITQLVKYYTDALVFAQSMDKACVNICEMLDSPLKTEVMCAMHFFVIANRFEIDKAKEGVCRMVHKIWDKDHSYDPAIEGGVESGNVRDLLVSSFYSIHMDPPESPFPLPLVITTKMLDLVASMTLSQLVSLEELIAHMAEIGRIPAGFTDTLWKVVKGACTVHGERPSSRIRCDALVLIGMVGKADKAVIRDNLNVLTRTALRRDESLDGGFVLARQACIAIQQLYHVKRQRGVYSIPMSRVSRSHPCCDRIISIFLENTAHNLWFGFAEQALNSLYIMVEQPDLVCAELICKLTRRTFGGTEDTLDVLVKGIEKVELEKKELEKERDTSPSRDESFGAQDPNDAMDRDEDAQTCVKEPTSVNNNFVLSQLFFVIGHVAIRQIVHLENIDSEWKRRKLLKQKNESDVSSKDKAKSELEMVTGSVEDEFTETMAMVREHELLFGPESLLSKYSPLLVHVLTHLQKFRDPLLQNMASLSLCKFMCVSSDFCQAHLPLLFTLLEHSNDPIMRSNLVIGLGDLAICFNSIIDEHISNLYNRLKDSDFYVKKNALMVLTFLILNGMIKVKGQISEMAKCCQDSNLQIQVLARAFFKELSTKDNAIYNNLPDIISNLGSVDEDQYKSIVKFIFRFIVKEKQNESIVEKLCQRFKHADTPRQWRDIGFSLSLLSFGTEKSVKKLMDYLALYQDKLYEPILYKYLMDITNKLLKGKPDWKIIVTDLKERLESAHLKAVEDHDSFMQAQNEVKGGNWKKYSGTDQEKRLSLPNALVEKAVDNDIEVDMQEEQDEVSLKKDDAGELVATKNIDDTDTTITDTEEIMVPVRKPTPKVKKSAKAHPKQPAGRKTRRTAVVSDSD